MGLAAAALRDTAFTWRTRETDHFRIHVQPDSYAADHLEQFVRDAEQARANGLRLLGEKHFVPRIDVFHLKSRDQMKRITEYPVRGWADPVAPLDSLARNFRSYNDVVAYLQAGSFFGYLLENYGVSNVRALWEEGFEAFEGILGKPPSVVDAEWRTHLEARYPDPKIDWAPLKEDGCR